MSEAFDSSNDDCRLVKLPRIHNRAGNITALNQRGELPFSPERIYYLYDVPGGESRGGHAHKSLHQYLIAGSGSFDVVLHDGKKEQRYHLSRGYYGLYVPKLVWRSMENFSTNSLALICSNITYDSNDYIRDRNAFTELTHE